MAHKDSSKNITAADAYAPPVPAGTASIRNPLEPLTAYSDGTIILPRQLTHDNIAREVKLVNLAKELKPDFEGVETEHNWGRRETNMIILRKITNSAIPEERAAVYISLFRGLVDGILKSATSLRTSLSLHGTILIQEAVQAVGSGLDQTFDILYTPLERQCLTKPAQAQAANNTMIALITNLSFHSRIIESISLAMDSKNKALRGYVIGWLDVLINHCSRTHLEAHVENLEKILRKGLSDADGIVRDKARVVFWTFSSKFKTRADMIYESLAKQSQKSLDAAGSQGAVNSKSHDSSLNRGPPPPRPATSHADRSSLKQFIKDKKKEAKKVEPSRPTIERPRSAAANHDRNTNDLGNSTQNMKRSARAQEAPPSRPESAASNATADRVMERRHAQKSSQDLKKAPRKHTEYQPDDQAIPMETSRSLTITPHAQKKAVRRPVEQLEQPFERPISSASNAAASTKPIRPVSKTAVPARPKTAASVLTTSTGTLSSAPKRPNFNRKPVNSVSTPSVKPTIDIPLDATADFHHNVVPPHIAHVITPPRVLPDPLPLQVLQNPPHNNVNSRPTSSQTKDDPNTASKVLPEFTRDKPVDVRSVSSGTLNVMASLISDRSNEVPKDAFDILCAALERGDVTVRRAGMDLGVALWKRVDDPIIFWSHLEGLAKGTKDFLMYWINRGRQAG